MATKSTYFHLSIPYPKYKFYTHILHYKVMYVKRFTSFCGIEFSHMDIAKRIGKNLKEARRDLHMTQAYVAERMRMTQQQYSRFENGVFELNYAQILDLCELYQITPNELFEVN